LRSTQVRGDIEPDHFVKIGQVVQPALKRLSLLRERNCAESLLPEDNTLVKIELEEQLCKRGRVVALGCVSIRLGLGQQGQPGCIGQRCYRLWRQIPGRDTPVDRLKIRGNLSKSRPISLLAAPSTSKQGRS